MQAPNVSRKLYEDGTITITPAGRRKGCLSEQEKITRRERMLEISHIKKTFCFSSKEKRKVKSSAIRLFRKKTNSIKWFTLTFSCPVPEPDANNCLSKFFENLKQNYELKDYVIVRENQNKAGEYFLHYHVLADIPALALFSSHSINLEAQQFGLLTIICREFTLVNRGFESLLIRGGLSI